MKEHLKMPSDITFGMAHIRKVVWGPEYNFIVLILDFTFFCFNLKPPIKANYAEAGTLQKERTRLARDCFGR
jgi:hypothetical protein